MIEGNAVAGSGQHGIVVGDNEIFGITKVDIVASLSEIPLPRAPAMASDSTSTPGPTSSGASGSWSRLPSRGIPWPRIGGHGISIEKGNDGSVCCIVVSGNTINDNLLSGVSATAGKSDTVIAGNVLLRNLGGPFSNSGTRNLLGGNTLD